MDSMVEENGNSNLDPLGDLPTQQISDSSSPQHLSNPGNGTNNSGGGVGTSTLLTTSANIVQYIPNQNIQTQSVIQANQSSVIQTATNLHPVTLTKGGVVYVNKGNSVIHTTPGMQLQIKPEPNTTPLSQINADTNSDDSLTDEDSPKRRRDLLTRRPSYHRILKDITGPDIGATTLQISNVQGSDSLHAIQTSGSGGTIVQYTTQSPDGQQFYVPGLLQLLQTT